ncbi:MULTISPECIES: hypothetical protein [Peptoniphilus]
MIILLYQFILKKSPKTNAGYDYRTVQKRVNQLL